MFARMLLNKYEYNSSSILVYTLMCFFARTKKVEVESITCSFKNILKNFNNKFHVAIELNDKRVSSIKSHQTVKILWIGSLIYYHNSKMNLTYVIVIKKIDDYNTYYSYGCYGYE